MLSVIKSELQRNFKSEFGELIDSGTENVPLFFYVPLKCTTISSVYHQNVPLRWYAKSVAQQHIQPIYRKNVPLTIFEWYAKCVTYQRIYKNVPHVPPNFKLI